MGLEKKLRREYIKGIEDGQELILQAIKETPGIGKTLEKRIHETALKLARRRYNV